MPSLRLTPRASRLLQSARVARLATADAAGQPHVIPICFVFDGKYFYSPIDEKPKQSIKLKRLSNIALNPLVSLVVDHYEENWRRLGYILVFGRARVLAGGESHRRAVRLLRHKYSQYRSMNIHRLPMIVITPRKWITWGKSYHSSTKVIRTAAI